VRSWRCLDTTSATLSLPKCLTRKSRGWWRRAPSWPRQLLEESRARAGHRGQFTKRRDRTRRPGDGRCQKRPSPTGSKRRGWARRPSTTSCATGCFAPAVLGRTLSGGARPKRPDTRGTRVGIARHVAGAGRFQAHRKARAAIEQGPRDWVRYSEKYRRETKHDAAVGGILLVLSAGTWTPKRKGAWNPEKEKYWIAGRSLYRGASTRLAPALQPVWHKVLFDRARQHVQPFQK